HITDTGHHKGFSGGVAIGFVLIPKPDQKKTAKPYAFPAQIKEQKIICQNEGQHGKHKQVHIGKEACIAFIAFHELGGIEMNQKTDESDHKSEYERQGIQIE